MKQDNSTDQSSTHGRALRRTYSRVVQQRPDITVLVLIKRIDTPDTIIEQLMEDETDTRSTGQLVDREVLRVSVDHCAELGAKLGNGREDDASRVSLPHGSSKRLELCRVFGELRADPSLDVRQGRSDVVHQDLNNNRIDPRSQPLGILLHSSSITMSPSTILTTFNFRAKYGVPQYCALLA